jgi:hypothetical protein
MAGPPTGHDLERFGCRISFTREVGKVRRFCSGALAWNQTATDDVPSMSSMAAVIGSIDPFDHPETLS